MKKGERVKQKIVTRHERHPSDNYATPPEIPKWAVEKCIKTTLHYCGDVKLSDLKMLEPGCGDSAPFCSYAASVGIESYGTDAREEVGIKTEHNLEIYSPANFLDPEHAPQVWEEKFDIIATNPPFKFGIEFIQTSLDMLTPRGVACFLMKLNFLGSQGRGSFFSKRPPGEVHILTKRPSFAHGATDRAQEYALLFWNGVEIDKRIRKERGRLSRIYWQENKKWKV